MTSPHHSFDIHLATEVKNIDLAILLHHFQFWILKNQRLKRNFYEGRTWTYETLQEIAAHFPYWSVKQVERLINKAIHLKLLKKGNFNKTKYDRTVWYAFENEEKFSISRNREMEEPNSGNGSPEIGKPIPDTNTDTNTDKEDTKSLPPKKQHNYCDRTQPATPISQKNQKTSDLAIALASHFFQKIKEIKSDFKKPNLDKWAEGCDKLLKVDNREPEKIKQLMDWALNDEFWGTNILSPQNLRKHFDRIEMQMSTGSSSKKDISEKNREWAQKIEKIHGDIPGVHISNKYIEFSHGQAVSTYEYGSKDFKKNVLLELKKKKINTEGLEQ